MKKLFAFLPIALLCMASCSESFTEEAAGTSANELQVSLGQSCPDTRVAFNTDRSMVWSEGDKLYAYNSSKSTLVTYNLASGAGSATGTFTQTSTSGFTPAYVILSENEPTSLSTSDVLTLTLPTEYTYVDGKHPIPMYGTVDTDGKVTLKHMMGYLRVTYNNLPAAATKLIVSADKVIAGEFTATLTATEPALAAVTSNTDNKSFTYNFTTTEGSSMTFYVPIPVGEYSFIKLMLQNGSGDELASIKFLNRTVARTMIYSINLNYSSTEIIIPSGSNSEATTEAGLASDIQAALNGATAGSTVTVNVKNAITTGTDKVMIPVQENVNLELNFEQAPTGTEALDIVDQSNSTSSSGDAKNAVKITMPGGSTIANMNVEMPFSTVTLESSGTGNVTYTSLTQKTATSTLVVEDNVKVMAIADGTGNTGKISVVGGEVTVAENATVAAIEIESGALTIPANATVTELVIADDEDENTAVPTITNNGTITNIDDQTGETTVTNGTNATITKPVQGKTGNTEAYYASIAAARTAGSTEITLNANISETLTEITSDLTLNLNGKTLTLNGNSSYQDYSNYQLYNPAIYLNGATAINVVINGGISATEATSHGKIVVDKTWFSGIYSKKGNLTLNYADIDFSDSNGFSASNAGILFWYDAGNLTINGGTINFGSKPSYGMDFEGPTLTIDGTTFTSTKADNGNSVIYFEVGTATIQNTTITSQVLGGVYASGSKTQSKNSIGTVKNCNITVNATNASGYSWMSSALAASHGSTLNVEGSTCTHQGEKAAAYVFSSGGTINLKSGTYTGTESCLRVDRSASDFTEQSVGSWIYYASSCTLNGNNSTNINEGFSGGIEVKAFE